MSHNDWPGSLQVEVGPDFYDRLVRGTAGQWPFEEELTALRELAQSQKRGDSRRAGQKAQAIGLRLFAGLAAEDQQRIRNRLGSPQRLILKLGDPRTWPLPWEALAAPWTMSGDKQTVDVLSLLSSWGVMRLPLVSHSPLGEETNQAPRPRKGQARRALVVLGSLLQDAWDPSDPEVDAAIRDGDYARPIEGTSLMGKAAQAVVRALRAAGLEVRVAFSPKAIQAGLMRVPADWAGAELREFAHAEHLEALFATDASHLPGAQPGETTGFDVVHIFSHGHPAKPSAEQDGEPGASSGNPAPVSANRLDLGFEGEDSCLPIEGAAGQTCLASLLARHPVRLLVLAACSTTEQLAPVLLRHVDHMIGMQDTVFVDTLRAWSEAFYPELTKSGSIVGAMQTARRVLAEAPSVVGHQWWLPAHHAAIEDDRPFVTDAEAALERYLRHEDGEGQHFRGLGLVLEQTLEEIAVPLRVHQLPSKQRLGSPTDPNGGTDGRMDGELLKSEPQQSSSIKADSRLAFERRSRGGGTLRSLIEGQGERRILLWGVMGSGKSTTLRQLQRAWRAEPDPPFVAIHVSLAALVHQQENPPPRTAEGLLDFVWRAVDRNSEPFLKAVQSLHGQGRLAFLLDGLDEVVQRAGDPDRNPRADLERFLRSLDANFPNAVQVLAGRPSAEGLPGYLEAELLELDLTLQEQLLGNVYRALGESDPVGLAREDANRLASGEASLAQLARVPLFLVLIALEIRGTKERDEQGQKRLPRGARHEFLANTATNLLEGKYQLQSGAAVLRPLPTPLVETEALLERIALWMTLQGWLTIGEAPLRSFLTSKGAKAIAPEVTKDPSGWLQKLNLSTGLFVRTPQGWAFWHRSFLESFTARALLEECRDDWGQPRVERLLERTREAFESAGPGSKAANGKPASDEQSARTQRAAFWREPLALLAGHLSELDPGGSLGLASRWVDGLLSDPATRAAGLAAVATADTLAPDVAKKALESCSSWEETLSVLDPLVGRFGQGERYLTVLEGRGNALVRRMRAKKFDLRVRIELWLVIDALDRLASMGARVVSQCQEAIGRLLAGVGFPAGLAESWARVPGQPALDLFAHVRGGTFTQGSPEGEEGRWGDEDQVERSVGEFAMARVPVKVGQYRLFDPDKFGAEVDDRLPAYGVSWFEAMLFTRWLDHHGGSLKQKEHPWADWTFRLPFEAEWEWACRDAPGPLPPGKAGYPRFGVGDSEADLAGIAWYSKNSGSKVQPVASAPGGASAPCLGLYDMLGNVLEWCRDPWIQHPQPEGPAQPPLGPRVARRVRRGGSAWNGARGCRAACRYLRVPDVNNDDDGFRVVLAPRPVSVPR